jgi:pimeloyl-ACP methyl ester carboxylesterase
MNTLPPPALSRPRRPTRLPPSRRHDRAATVPSATVPSAAMPPAAMPPAATRASASDARGSPDYTVQDRHAGVGRRQICWRAYLPTGLASPLAQVWIHGACQTSRSFEVSDTPGVAWASTMAVHGSPTYLLDLPHHGRSTAWDVPLERLRVDDYVSAVHLVIEDLGLGTAVLLGGHGLGAGVALRYAEQHPVAGLALLGGLPVHLWGVAHLALMRALLRESTSSYVAVHRQPGRLFASEQRQHDWLLGPTAPPALVEEVASYLGHESPCLWRDMQRAALVDIGRRLTRRRLRAPRLLPAIRNDREIDTGAEAGLLWIAFREDALCPPHLVRQAASEYGGTYVELRGQHNGMQTGQWQDAAQVVAEFATERTSCVAPADAARLPSAEQRPAQG